MLCVLALMMATPALTASLVVRHVRISKSTASKILARWSSSASLPSRSHASASRYSWLLILARRWLQVMCSKDPTEDGIYPGLEAPGLVNREHPW